VVIVVVVIAALWVVIMAIGSGGIMIPIVRELILGASKACFFYGPLKYVTRFLSILLANSAKYPSARSCAKFYSNFMFLTLNTPTLLPGNFVVKPAHTRENMPG